MLMVIRCQDCNVEHDAVVYNTCMDACSKHSRVELVDQLLEVSWTVCVLQKFCGNCEQFF